MSPRSVTLRPWQKAALERLSSSTERDFLAVATPGAGKTTFALTAARTALAATTARRLVVVVPTAHLKRQWAEAAMRFDLHLDPGWSAGDGRLPADMHGVVTTYQQVATSAAALRAVADRAFVVFDEVHHAADERAWGDAVRLAFEGAARRLSLSGTPFRSDTSPIPFVRYDDGEARPDFEYGYGDALADGGVVRPVYFPRLDGHMEWTAPDGSLRSHTFDDALDHSAANQRLRTALSVEGEWLPHVLAQAHTRLVDIRRSSPTAAGLVVAIDQDHAHDIAAVFHRRLGVRAVVATSDDPDASTRISKFALSDEPWLVAVRMVSEGVDIPRLRVGVFATTTTTELFFRQAVGRLVRWVRGGGRQPAFLFIPDDPRLRTRAVRIAEQRRHSIRKEHDDRERVDAVARSMRDDFGDPEQLSLFAPLSATPLGDATEPASIWDLDPGGHEPLEDATLVLDLPPLPGALTPPAGAMGALGAVRRDQKKKLRDANADWTRLIVRRTGMSHAQVNAELNRLVGLTRITEATAEQLERRLRAAERWLASMPPPRPADDRSGGMRSLDRRRQT
ncbi:MAG TPA: DEAD/DEAH box helicase [Acidimicrobiales bacterium]